MAKKKTVKKKKKRKEKKRIPALAITLWILTILSIFLAFKTSNEPVLRIFKNTSIETLFRQFTIGNSLVFSVSMGFLVSMIFYLLVVWIPDRRRKDLIKCNFKEQYRSFKHDAISIFLMACQGHHDSELPRKLSEQSEFVKFFREPVDNDSRNIKWYTVLNGLDEHHLKDLLVVMEIFMNEIAYVLNNVKINEAEVFAFFKRFSQAVYQLKNSTFEGDEIKSLDNFIWQIFGGFSFVDGQRDYDVVQAMINKI